MGEVSFTVAGIPTAKGRPRFVRATGRTYTDAETQSAELTMADAAAKKMDGRDLLEGVLCLHAVFYFPRPKGHTNARRDHPLGHLMFVRPDVDNLLKLVKDSLNGVVYRDDGQIQELIGRKEYGNAGRTDVVVTQICDGLFRARPKATPRAGQGALELMEVGR